MRETIKRNECRYISCIILLLISCRVGHSNNLLGKLTIAAICPVSMHLAGKLAGET